MWSHRQIMTHWACSLIKHESPCLANSITQSYIKNAEYGRILHCRNNLQKNKTHTSDNTDGYKSSREDIRAHPGSEGSLCNLFDLRNQWGALNDVWNNEGETLWKLHICELLQNAEQSFIFVVIYTPKLYSTAGCGLVDYFKEEIRKNHNSKRGWLNQKM